jgi:hypothetical protein
MLMLRELIAVGEPRTYDPYARQVGQIEKLCGWTLIYDSIASVE